MSQITFFTFGLFVEMFAFWIHLVGIFRLAPCMHFIKSYIQNNGKKISVIPLIYIEIYKFLLFLLPLMLLLFSFVFPLLHQFYR